MIVDTDVHPLFDSARIAEYLPEPWRRRYIVGNRGPGDLGYWNPNGVRRADAVLADGDEIASQPDALLRDFLDPHTIDYCLLNPDYLNFALSPEADFAAAVASAVNQVLINDWLSVSKRLLGSMVVSPQDPYAAADEIRRIGSNPQVVQVLLPSASPLPYGSRYFHPIYDAAHEMELSIGIHPGLEGTGISGAPTAVGYPGSYLEFHTGLIGSYIAHLLSFVCEGVFSKFERLKVVMIEGGVSWLPSLLWRFDKNWKGLRQTVPWLVQRPSEIVSEHILITTQPLEEPERPEELRQILRMFDSAAMLMFSSDFPHWDGDTPDYAGRAFPEEIRRAVMGSNAEKLYRIGVAR